MNVRVSVRIFGFCVRVCLASGYGAGAVSG